VNHINHRINCRDSNEAEIVRACEIGFKILCEVLNLDGLTLQVQRQAGWAGSDAHHAGMFTHKGEVKINLRNLGGCSVRLIMGVLGHEMRHAYQHSQGWLKNGYKWHNLNGPLRQHHDKRYQEYLNRPQEIDARMFQNAYAEMIMLDPRFREYFGIVYEQEPVMIECKVATAAKYHRENDEMFRFILKKDGPVHFMYASQFGTSKKITKKIRMTAFTEHRELLESQVIVPVMREIALDDLVSQ